MKNHHSCSKSWLTVTDKSIPECRGFLISSARVGQKTVVSYWRLMVCCSHVKSVLHIAEFSSMSSIWGGCPKHKDYSVVSQFSLGFFSLQFQYSQWCQVYLLYLFYLGPLWLVSYRLFLWQTEPCSVLFLLCCSLDDSLSLSDGSRQSSILVLQLLSQFFEFLL